MPRERVLVVDDELQILHFCRRVLAGEGYQVQTADRGQTALEILEREPFDLLVLDVKIPDIGGLDILRRARERDPNLTAVIITGYATLDSAIEALTSGARGFVLKPFGVEEFSTAIQEALAQRRRELERLRLRAQLPILEISQALMTDGSVEAMAGPLLEAVVRQMAAARATLSLHDPETDELCVAHVVVPKEKEAEEPYACFDPDLARQALSQDETQVQEADSACVVYVPLRARQRTVGALCLSRPAEAPPFNATDLGLLSVMGRQIATALENARLYEQIREARDYARTILDSLHDQVLVIDRDYAITDVNEAFLQTTGYSRDEVVGRPCHEISHRRKEPCDEPDQACPAQAVWCTGQPARDLHVHHDRTGQSLFIDVAVAPVRRADGQVTHVVEAHRDVTAEWRLESSLAAIRALGQQLVLLRDEAEIAGTVVDTAQQMLGFSICGLWLVDDERQALMRRAHAGAARNQEALSLPLDGEQGITVATVQSGEATYVPDVRQDPRYVQAGADTLSELCVPLMVKDRVIGVLNAESQRRDAFEEADQQLLSTLADQAALALENAQLFDQAERLKEFNESLIQNMAEGIVREDPDGIITFVNPAGAAMIGRTPEEMIGRPWIEFIPPDQQGAIRKANERRRRGESDRYELVIQYRDGTRLPVLVAGRPMFEGERFVGTLAVFSNLAEVKQLQAQLIQSEKLAALGRLAASLAHEINNPLQALSSGLGLLVSREFEERKRKHYLEVANREVERLISITERMLSFYRPLAERRELADVNHLVDETLALVNKKLQHSHVTVSRDLAGQNLLVEAISDELKQVFLNIILNALDAMPRGGHLAVRTSRSESQDEVCISFTDSGEGIAQENIQRIFEPFFTTKAKGTGLGLAVSYGIVERHGGRIEVRSAVGEGSTFVVCLPGV